MPDQYLRNDRGDVIGIVVEFILFNDMELHRAKIRPISERPKWLKPTQYNSNWSFAYNARENIIYATGVGL